MGEGGLNGDKFCVFYFLPVTGKIVNICMSGCGDLFKRNKSF